MQNSTAALEHSSQGLSWFVRLISVAWLLLVAPAFVPTREVDAQAGSSELPAFWKSRVSDVEAAVKEVRNGEVRVLTKSAGGRNIYLVTYGEKQHRSSTANYNSAVAGLDPASYSRKDGTQPPVLFLLGPV